MFDFDDDEEFYENCFTDIITGNFYNKERKNAKRAIVKTRDN